MASLVFTAEAQAKVAHHLLTLRTTMLGRALKCAAHTFHEKHPLGILATRVVTQFLPIYGLVERFLATSL